MDSTESLISGYLDNELDERQLDRLTGLLQSESSAVDCLVVSAFIHSHLSLWMDQQRTQDSVVGQGLVVSDAGRHPFLQDAVNESMDCLFCDYPEFDESAAVLAGPQRFRPRALAAWAAVLLLALGVTFGTYFAATRTVYVAQLTEATDCRWKADQPDIPRGALLESGQDLQLVAGRALITFVSGAQMLVVAPATLRLDGASEVRLHAGKIAAKVPTQAIGFRVSTSLASFVDLGTEFTLELAADDAFELYVFEGMVEVQVDQRFGEAAHQPLRVPEVRAVQFKRQSGAIVALPFDQGETMPF